jgi:hypothetical protein
LPGVVSDAMSQDTQDVALDSALIDVVAHAAAPDESAAEWIERAVRCQLEREREEIEIAVPIPEKVRRRAELEAAVKDGTVKECALDHVELRPEFRSSTG